MAEAAANPVIAALRGASAKAPTGGSGPQALAYPWMSRVGSPLVLPPRNSAKPNAKSQRPPTPTTPPLPPAVTPPGSTEKTVSDFVNGNFTYEDLKGIGGDNWDRMTGDNPNPTAIVLEANKDRVGVVDTANPVLNLAQRDPQRSPPSPVATIGMDEMGDKFGLNVGDFSNLSVVDIPNPYADSMPYEFDFGDINGGVPSDGVQVVAQKPSPELVAATSPVTDEMSVRQTLEQILADQAPQPIEPPTQVVLPPDVNIPAFDSGIDFQMPETLFRTPAPFVPGFTPDADVYAAMQAPIAPAPAPATTPVPEPEYIDPGLLAMLGGETAPVPATQPVPEEPIYADEFPWWMLNEGAYLR